MLTEGGHPLPLPRFMLLTARCSVPNLQVSGGRKAELWGSFWGPAPEAWVSKAPALQQDWGGKKKKRENPARPCHSGTDLLCVLLPTLYVII